MPFKSLCCIAGLLASLAVTSVSAAVVNYDETIDGDLTLAPIPVQIDFTTPGVQTVRGTFGRGEIDKFFFTLAPGLRLVAFNIETFNTTPSGVSAVNAGLRLQPETGFDPFFEARLNMLTGALTIETPLIEELTEGRYRFQNGIASNAIPGQEPAFSTDYVLRFDVDGAVPAPVPVPAAIFPLVLGMSGLCALGRMGKRRA